MIDDVPESLHLPPGYMEWLFSRANELPGPGSRFIDSNGVMWLLGPDHVWKRDNV